MFIYSLHSFVEQYISGRRYQTTFINWANTRRKKSCDLLIKSGQYVGWSTYMLSLNSCHLRVVGCLQTAT